MSMHEFGIMETAPVSGERFDVYEPEKYNCISVNDDFIEPVIHKLTGIKFFAHTVDFPINGLNYCGITLIPPESAMPFISVIEGTDGFSELCVLLRRAYSENKWVIHFGI
ncbi:MAG: hypothetical protein J6A37_10180 [Oscillospiraceae bacterium]|nr:hypothetical protein [Oscillospiraceae bacterium]